MLNAVPMRLGCLFAAVAPISALCCNGKSETPPNPPTEVASAQNEPAALRHLPQVERLRKEAIKIRTLVADEDFSDLAPLRKTLEGVRLVQLGEQTHGDGATFEAKVRLIKFLHREMGFGVVAFESGLYDCDKAWKHIRAGADAIAAARGAIFPLWSRSAQVTPLWRYISQQATSEQPLVLAGFDSQFTGRFSYQELIRELGQVTGKPETAKLLAPVIKHGPKKTPKKKRKQIRDAIASLTNATSGADAAFWKQLLRSIRAQAESQWEQEDGGLMATMSVASNAGRDRQMAANLIWLANERYPGKKIIVWGATMHLARNTPTLEEKGLLFGRSRPYEKLRNMGHFVHQEFGKQVYTIGFLAREGKWALAGGSRFSAPIEKAPKGSFADLFTRAGFELAFLDLRGRASWGAEMVARPMGYAEMMGDWTNVVDGFFFTRKMTPSTTAQ